MSWANRELRKEARGFFFANNTFEVCGSSRSSHADFLTDIGPDGRASIAKLKLVGTHFSMYTAEFCSHLTACSILRELTLYVHGGHMVKRGTYTEIREYVKSRGDAWTVNGRHVELNSLVDVLTRISVLQVLHINFAIPSWHLGGYAMGIVVNEVDDRLFDVEEEIMDNTWTALEKGMKGRIFKQHISIHSGAPQLTGEEKKR